MIKHSKQPNIYEDFKLYKFKNITAFKAALKINGTINGYSQDCFADANLINCSACFNCVNCTNCHSCVYCEDSEHLAYCKCTTYSSFCLTSHTCHNCHLCIQTTKAKNSTFCYNVTNADNITAAVNYGNITEVFNSEKRIQAVKKLVLSFLDGKNTTFKSNSKKLAKFFNYFILR